jgi:hypothetical protein
MEAKKSPAIVKKMFESGQVSFVDPETRYRYSLTAKCPGDGEYADVARFEKAGHSLTRVVFSCASCTKEFEVPKSEMLVV